ncbi:hypothetical protein AGABI2DRAFT_134878, partial [Agaricus bisporus var. bisporus H97]|uniref:hypothetical protein n=1 Tax=Agaricus bisporus var. bisporus (strain H97 / ATCC MYA-4626 / FGSC 10389) TaxID=936046 RepID=UPI00029F5DC0
MYLFFLAVFILAEIDRSLSFFYTSVPVSEVDMLPQQSSRACNALFHSRTSVSYGRDGLTWSGPRTGEHSYQVVDLISFITEVQPHGRFKL